jgi:uncharacterized protein YbjQ (UPF0145 family)
MCMQVPTATHAIPQQEILAAAGGQAAPLISAEDVERNIMQHHSQILSTIEARNESMLRHLADSSQQMHQQDALKSLVAEQKR